MIYIIMGNHQSLGHYMRHVPIGAYDNEEDANFSKELSEKVFGWNCYIEKLELNPKIYKESRQRIIDAGYTIPQHMEP